MKSEIERFPRLFRAVESVPGLTWPTHGVREAHDAVAGQAAGGDHAARARPHQGRHGGLAAAGEDPVLRRSGRVRRHAVHRRCLSDRLAGDARRDRGAAAREAGARAAARRCRRRRRCKAGLDGTRAFVTAMFERGEARRARRARTCARSTARPTRRCKPKFGHWVIFDHCLPFDVTRAYDEATRLSAIRASGRRSATRRCGRRSKAERRGDARDSSAARVAVRQSGLRVPALAGAGRRRRAPSGGRRRRRARSASPRRSTSRSAACPVLVLDDDDTVSVGSRAICYAKRTLEILDRLGCGEPVAQQGRGLERRQGLPRRRARVPVRPAARARATTGRRSSTCSSTTSRSACVERAARAAVARAALAATRSSAVAPRADGAALTRRDAGRRLRARLRLARRLPTARAARCARMLGLESEGQVFRDRFLIADIRMTSDFPAERWFWFDPPFHPNQSVLLHRQADDVWRIDFQLGWDADPERGEASRSGSCRACARCSGDDARVRARMGERLHLPVPAHAALPPRPRAVRRRRRAPGVARSARAARTAASRTPTTSAGSSRSCCAASRPSGCSTPTTPSASRPPTRTSSTRPARPTSSRRRAPCRARSATRCSRSRARHPFARKLVNSGRLSVPAVLAGSPLNTPDADDRSRGAMVPGAPAADAPVRGPRGDWLLDYLGGGFVLLAFGDARARGRRARRSRSDASAAGVVR